MESGVLISWSLGAGFISNKVTNSYSLGFKQKIFQKDQHSAIGYANFVEWNASTWKMCER